MSPAMRAVLQLSVSSCSQSHQQLSPFLQHLFRGVSSLCAYPLQDGLSGTADLASVQQQQLQCWQPAQLPQCEHNALHHSTFWPQQLRHPHFNILRFQTGPCGTTKLFSSSSSGMHRAAAECEPFWAMQQPNMLYANVQQPLQLQLQQKRGIKQLIPHALAPKPLPRFRKPSKDGRMNRMVIRIPPQVHVELQDNELRLSGKAGSSTLKLPFLDPTGLVAWQAHVQSAADAAAGPGTGSLLLLASPSKRCWRGIQTHINNAVHGVMQGYLVGVAVQGVGYRMEPVPEKQIAAALAAKRGAATAQDAGSSKRRIIWEIEAEKTNIAYPHKEPAKAVRLKVGYTKACIFQLPEGVLAFFVKPTLMYLYGIDKALVTNTAAAIRAVRKPNAYTGNGIQLVGEVLKLKQRAGSK